MSTAVAQKPSPAKQATPKKKKKRKASVPGHPTYKEMIMEAIEELNEPKNGASRMAIRKVVEDRYAPKNVGIFMNKNLAKMVADGELKHPIKFPGKYIIDTDKAEKKTTKRSRAVAEQQEKAAEKPKSVERKLKVKSAKKSPEKRGRPKSLNGPRTPKTTGSTEKKRGRGRPKK